MMRMTGFCLIATILFTVPLYIYTKHSASLEIGSKEIGSSEYSKGSPYVVESGVEGGDLGLSSRMPTSELETATVMDKMAHEIGGHEKHQMPKIKLSKHKLVSTSQKGYGLAVAITLLIGTSFAIMHIGRRF